MNEKTRKITLVALAVGIGLCLVLGISSAFLKNVELSTSVTELSLNSCAKIMLVETGTAINLSNTAPMSDTKALETTPYEFSVKSSCDVSVNYKIYLALLSTNTLSASKVKYAIKDKDANAIIETGIISEKPEATSDFDSAEQTQITSGIKGTASNIYTIMNTYIVGKTEKTYQLYLWVAAEAGNEAMNKTFTAGVAAKSFSETVILNIADACKGKNMASCFKQNSSVEDTIIHHNGSITSSTGAVLDANDDSYRYTGANPNNYVCFGSTATTCPNDNLYRIIGIFENQVKLIKTTSVATGRWSGSSSNSSNVWANSTLNTSTLNGTYLNGLGATWSNKIATTNWKVGGLEYDDMNTPKEYYEGEVGTNSSSTTYPAKIGLMYVSDYGYAANSSSWTLDLWSYGDATANNWLYAGIDEWTISRDSATADSAHFIHEDGYVTHPGVHYYDYGARPAFYLNSSVTLSGGTGTQSNPYRIA